MKMPSGVLPVALGLALAANASRVHAQVADEGRSWATQQSTGEVTLDVVRGRSADRLIIALSANTHTVDLGSVDLREAVRVFVGNTAYAPREVEALSGHHGEAKLLFALPEPPSASRVEIRGVPDVPLRTLTWPPESGGS